MVPTPPMESEANCRNDHITPLPLPSNLSNINLKLELLDDFCANNLSSSKGYLQDILNLDQFPFVQTNIANPIGPFGHEFSTDFGSFCQGPSTNFDVYELNEENGSTSVQDFQGGGFLNFPGREDPLMEMETALQYHDLNPLCFVLPDETSCVTADNLGCKRSKNSIQGKERESVSTGKCGRGRTKSKSEKGQWTAEEDRLLIHLVEKYGVRRWSNIAQVLKGRIGKQCRERWHNHLRPDIKKDVWTEEEDRILIEVHAKVGNKWAEIAKNLPGRTENSIKNHWNATKRRQFTKRKCRSKWPKPSSLLQDYIKSLVFKKEGVSELREIQRPTAADSRIDDISSVSAQNKTGNEFSLGGYTVPEYEFDEFTFDDDCFFEGSNVGSFLDDLPICPSPGIDGELPLPELMGCEVKKEFDFFDGSE